MYISYSSCAKAKTNMLSSVSLWLVLDWKGTEVLGKDKASTPTLTVSFTLCLTHKILNWYKLSLISIIFQRGRIIRPLNFLHFWRLMPKGEKVLGPKQMDRTTIFKFKISIGISFGFKISIGIISVGIYFKNGNHFNYKNPLDS